MISKYETEANMVKVFNSTYEETGYEGVVNLVGSMLDYGKVELLHNDCVMIVTAGWSEDELIVEALMHPASIFWNKHYVGFLRGGAYYFSRDIDKLFMISPVPCTCCKHSANGLRNHSNDENLSICDCCDLSYNMFEKDVFREEL